MSKRQRRDHRPQPVQFGEEVTCVVCGDQLVEVSRHYTDRFANDLIIDGHWRHQRRWHKEPLP